MSVTLAVQGLIVTSDLLDQNLVALHLADGFDSRLNRAGRLAEAAITELFIFSADGTCIVASWLNVVSVVRYPSTARLLELAKEQGYRELTTEERVEFGLLVEGGKVGGNADGRSLTAAG
jgi:hypothetical protein